MMPPTRIEQLNNFQDAVQSPDGLDRLRALQAVEQALPSSQGLMGMPQVQAPMPMVPRQYGGEIGTGGLVEVLDVSIVCLRYCDIFLFIEYTKILSISI